MPSLVGSEMCIRDRYMGEGLPVGYEVFPGDTYEGKTFKTAIDQIKKHYNVKRAIVVADSGLLSKENISLLEEEHLEYIVGARLRSCLLYTSDAADDMQCVDLGGRRIIKKKKKIRNEERIQQNKKRSQ
eukprot:TRINITY_DN13774_c0_g1_i3.p2 TRINITY_DN13774_c0_g1~~TRINITY_DN13774_c0_g1_i3.p2  ORF type:complete len:129 (-),score=29.58 TRINITY_DN13774_c0_g1_i3:37-423(-)